MITKKIRILIIFFVIFTLSLANSNTIKVMAKRGAVNLKTVDFSKSVVRISGVYEFYWMEFIDAKSDRSHKDFINVPNSWTDSAEISKDEGYASYRLIIKGLKEGEQYGISVGEIINSYKIYINGEQIFENGKISNEKKFWRKSLLPRAYYFEAKKNNTELIFHVASFDSHKGGLTEALILGEAQKIMKRKIKSILFDAIIFGIILFMAFYHLMLYMLRTREKSSLYFSLFTFTLALRAILINERLLHYINFEYTYSFFTKLEIASAYIAVPLFLLYLREYYKSKNENVVFYLLLVIGYILTGAVFIFSNQFVLKYTITLFEFYVVTSILYSMMIILINWKLEVSKYFLFGFLFIFLGVINDILNEHLIISSMHLTPFALILFLFIHVILLAKKFTSALYLSEKLSDELKVYNEGLEVIVKERTEEIELINSALEAKNDEMISSIEYAEIIQNSILTHVDEIKKHIREYFIIYKPRDIVGGDFYWGKEIDDGYLFAVVDCSGHGVPGALMSMMANAVLDSVTTHIKDKRPDKILHQVNLIIKSHFTKKKTNKNIDEGFDIGLCLIKKNERKLIYSGAKINLYYSDSNKNILSVKGNRQSIGFKRSKLNYQYSSTEISIDENQVFYFMSDGFEDQNGGEHNKSFGRKRIINLLEEINQAKLKYQKSILEESLIEYMKDNEQRDDITVVGFRV